METTSPCRARRMSYHSSHPLRNSADSKFSFMPTSQSQIDLSLYKDISEIYREAMAPTCVYTATRPNTGEKIAIKKIFKDELVNDFQRAQAKQEFPLHCSLKHSNIVQGLEWAETAKEHILVMEYMNNADYFKDKIETRLSPIKNEEKMKSYAYEVLQSLSYLHAKGNVFYRGNALIAYAGIVHGDIKLENLLVQTFEDDSIPVVKLCDFGLSRILDQNTGKFLMTIPVGSVSYMAPEIKSNAQCNEKVDMWALGIVLYKMAVAYKPTQISGYKYGDGPLPFRRADWRKKSKELQDLITKLIEIDVDKRLSANQALEHPWFQDVGPEG